MTFDELQLLVQSIAVSQRETQQIVQSIARGVQAMQEKALSDELKREEERAEHQIRMQKLEDISAGLVNLLGAIDEDRPTILRKLNTIETKTDAIFDRLDRQ